MITFTTIFAADYTAQTAKQAREEVTKSLRDAKSLIWWKISRCDGADGKGEVNAAFYEVHDLRTKSGFSAALLEIEISARQQSASMAGAIRIRRVIRLCAEQGVTVTADQVEATRAASDAEHYSCREAVAELVSKAEPSTTHSKPAVGTTEAVPAADISACGLRDLHEPIAAEAALTYCEKVFTRAYIARSIGRNLASHDVHAAKYTAQDIRWLAEHNADHAYRNGVLTAAEFAEIYSLIRAENAKPLAMLAAMRQALLKGWPVMDIIRAI